VVEGSSDALQSEFPMAVVVSNFLQLIDFFPKKKGHYFYNFIGFAIILISLKEF